MDKPEKYTYYSNSRNHIPYNTWPQECKDYHEWRRDIRIHPEWKDLTPEEIQVQKTINKKNRARYGLRGIAKKYQSMSDEERTEWNRKKGNAYNNLSEEGKVERNKELRQTSLNFWASMTPEERKKFSRYRWDLKSDDEKELIIKRFNQAGINRIKSLSSEEIARQVNYMNECKLRKWLEDDEYRETQTKLLRKHCMEYFSKLTPSEMSALQSNNKLNTEFEKAFNESRACSIFYYEKERSVKRFGTFKSWDYTIFRKCMAASDENAVMVVELDGSFNHGNICDYDGNFSDEERDSRRGYFIPNPNCLFCVIPDSRFRLAFDDMLKKLFTYSAEDELNNLFEFYRSIEFPYPSYTSDELIKSFNHLIRFNTENDYYSLGTRNRIGDRLIYNFHHSIYHAHRHGKPSPYDAWYNDELLRKCIRNRTLYQNYLNPNKILQGFNVSKIAPKVSVFSAAIAKTLIHKYLSKYDTIFDPFSGFSGRMLGTISLSKKYIGQDISYTHIRESKNMIEFLNQYQDHFPNYLEPTLNVGNSILSYGTYQCLFTCPPYRNKEIWKGGVESNKSCDEWIDICLSNFKCKRYLFVVDETEKYSEYIIDTIVNKSHFGTNNEFVILIDR